MELNEKTGMNDNVFISVWLLSAQRGANEAVLYAYY